MLVEASGGDSAPPKVTQVKTRAGAAVAKMTKRKQRTSVTDSSSLVQEDPEVFEIQKPKHKRQRVNRKRMQSSARDSKNCSTSSSSSPPSSSGLKRIKVENLDSRQFESGMVNHSS